MSEEQKVVATIFLDGLIKRPVGEPWTPAVPLTRWQRMRRWLAGQLMRLADFIWAD